MTNGTDNETNRRPSTQIDRLVTTAEETLTMTKQIKTLLSPPDSGGKNPLEDISRYLIWLFRHVGDLEIKTDEANERLKAIEDQLAMLLKTISTTSVQATSKIGKPE